VFSVVKTVVQRSLKTFFLIPVWVLFLSGCSGEVENNSKILKTPKFTAIEEKQLFETGYLVTEEKIFVRVKSEFKNGASRLLATVNAEVAYTRKLLDYARARCEITRINFALSGVRQVGQQIEQNSHIGIWSIPKDQVDESIEFICNKKKP
jgi:hypothetical protein